jgi:hypothetical protein
MSYESSTALKGGLGGAGTGAAIGSILGPVGVGIGAILGAVVGAASGKATGANYDEALAGVMAIPEVDPTQTKFLDELTKERNLIQRGLTTEFQFGKDLLSKANATTLNKIMNLSGGNPAVAINAATQLQTGLADSTNKLLAGVAGRTDNYTTAIGQMIDNIAQRKLDVQTYKTTQQLGIATQELADVNLNANAGLMQGFSAISGLGGGDMEFGDGFISDLLGMFSSREEGEVNIF